MLTQNSLGRMLPSVSGFGQFLRIKRIEKGFSQRGLAKVAGLSGAAISMIERGERLDLRADTARRIALALELDVTEVMNELEPVPA